MIKFISRGALILAVCALLAGGLGLFGLPVSEARGTTWSVSVYNNPDVAGTPIWTGVSSSISYSWGTGAPVINGTTVPGAPIDNFSVRFTGTPFFSAGTYRFTVLVDDGVRVSVDGVLLINQWTGGSERTFQADRTFSSDGYHSIQLDYFDAVDQATIVLSWAIASGTLACTEGYAYTVCPISSVSGSSSAPSNWPPSSGPSAICNDGWNSCSTSASGTCSSHSGVREWCVSSSLSYSGIPWYAEYYNSSDFTNGPIYTTTYSPSGLNLNWGEGSPGGSVTVDNFTARFTRSLTVPTDLAQGVYTFYARADDNFRFYVDSTLVMDHWDAFAADQTYTADVTLLTGGHTLKFEYREQTSGAYVFLTWTPPYAQNPILDPSGGTSIVSGTTGSTAAGITATVNVSVLNFRNAPNATAQIISKLSKGAVYAASGRNGDNTWVQIVVDSTSGWVVAQYVTLSGDINVLPIVTPTVSPTAVPAVPQPIGVRGKVYGNLRIREQPTTSAKQIGLMPWGSEMDLLGINEGRSWYMVSYDGLVGWAYAPWIRIIEGSFDQLPYTDGTQPVYEPPPATQGVIAQAYGNMRIRSGPSLSATKIARAVWGTRVEVLARSTNLLWYKVRYGDVVGWTYAAWYRIVQGDVSTLPASNE